MGNLLKAVGAFAAALVLGVGSAVWMVSRGLAAGEVSSGPWRTNLAIGSEAADPYTRATVARAGLLALNRSETLYFTAATDSDGAALNADCHYRLEGGDLPARWWSVTAYGADHFLIPNPQERYSYGGNTVARAADGSYTIHVAPEPETDAGTGADNWIPSGNKAQPFSLTIRLYNPSEAAAADPGSIALPRVVRESCP